MNAPSPEIDLWESAFLEGIKETDRQGLRLLIAEARSSKKLESVKLANIEIEAFPIVKTGRKFEIAWANYIAYSVRNESYCTVTPEQELAVGKRFRIYTKSYFLDYVSRATLATVQYPGPFLHYELLTENHVVDVVSTNMPVVRAI